uniref:Uncharacterized protein n=1 Tax=Arundo donax TaxID=35708 RepID=A0A0A8Y1S9_ARUDO
MDRLSSTPPAPAPWKPSQPTAGSSAIIRVATRPYNSRGRAGALPSPDERRERNPESNRRRWRAGRRG